MALDVEAELKYCNDKWERPHFYLCPQSGHVQEKFATSWEKLTIHDGRELNMTIPNNGFQLFNHETSLRNEDFYSDDPSMVTGKYYEEMSAVVKELTGAKYVVPFHYNVRSKQEVSGQNNWQRAMYSSYIHNDVNFYSAELTFKKCGSNIDKKDLRGKYMIVNTWRSISDRAPVKNNHLTLLDCTSLTTPDDFVLATVHAGKIKSQQWLLNNAKKNFHRWVYYPNMVKNELLVFTQYDSDPKATARHTFHTSFKDPTASSDAPSRESVEVRLLCVFPNHEPNTCPVFVTAKAGATQASYEGIIDSLKNAKMWPPEAKLWMRSCAGNPMIAMKGVLKGCVEKDIHGLGGASEEFQKNVLALLEENIVEVDRLMLQGFGGKVAQTEVLVDGMKFVTKYVSTSPLIAFLVGILVGAPVMRCVFQSLDQQNWGVDYFT